MSADTKANQMSSAVLSDNGTYRYRLGRRWADHGPSDVWIMLNPSTADAMQDDPTIRRCIGFSKSWGAASLTVVNLFALRSTNPAALLRHPDPIGPDNDDHTAVAATSAGRVIAAWGSHPMAGPRAQAVQQLLRPHAELLCLGTTKAGAPRHPLYVRATTQLAPWTTP